MRRGNKQDHNQILPVQQRASSRQRVSWVRRCELRDPGPHRRFGSWEWSPLGWRHRLQKGESTWWKKCRMRVMQRIWKLYFRGSLWTQSAAGSSKLIKDLCTAYGIKCSVHRETGQTNWQDMSAESRLEKVSWEINFQIFNLLNFIYFYPHISAAFHTTFPTLRKMQ